jgi:hypothetical protein
MMGGYAQDSCAAGSIQDRDKWRALVTMVENRRVLNSAGNFLPSAGPSGYPRCECWLTRDEWAVSQRRCSGR